MNKEQKKRLFKRLFNKSTFKEGQFVKFPRGKVIWQVSDVYSSGHYVLRSMNGVWGIGRFVRKQKELIEVPESIAFVYILKVWPPNVFQYFSETQLKKAAKHIYTDEKL